MDLESFFSSMYCYSSGLYSYELDSFLDAEPSGYLRVGVIMIVVSLIVSALYYYRLKPVNKQTAKWFGFYGINAVINFLVAIGFSMTPLVNNEVSLEEAWTYLDCVFFGIANVFWAFIFYVIAALILKWWSINKYVPFQKF